MRSPRRPARLVTVRPPAVFSHGPGLGLPLPFRFRLSSNVRVPEPISSGATVTGTVLCR